ncbi:MAG: hypothetical protein LBD04_02785, partial [Synergistaceae bacterium]|nr:hypothetical protein [Synergistaceae bacterium]
IFKLNTCSTMIFKNNDTRVEKPYDTRICRNMIITWATLSLFQTRLIAQLFEPLNFFPEIVTTLLTAP